MRSGARRRGSVIALLAVAIVVVQASLVAWAGAAMAARPMLDAFGNVLCVTGGERSGEPSGEHGAIPNCCTLGSVGEIALPAEPSDAVAFLIAFAIVSDPAPVDQYPTPPPRGERDPGRPRGPPLRG